MKNIKFLLSLFIFSVLLSQGSMAISVPTNQSAEQNADIRKMQKDSKSAFKIEKRIAKVEQRIGHGIDFNDATDKWLWIAVFGFGAGILLGLIGLNALAGICGFVGLIAIIVWIVKKIG